MGIDWGTVIVGLLALIGTIAGSVLTGSKTTALILYRLDNLERKQDKHNSVIERTYSIEKEVAELKVHSEEMRSEVNRILNKA